MEIQNRIERFEIEIKNLQKNNIINGLLRENRNIYNSLIVLEKVKEENTLINIAYTSLGIFIQYKLTNNDNYLKTFIHEKMNIIHYKKESLDELYHYHVLKFMVNFIQLCFLVTQDKSYLSITNYIYVELLFRKNNHNIVHKIK